MKEEGGKALGGELSLFRRVCRLASKEQ